MNGSQLPTNQLHDINWGALDHASRAPQLMSCNYYVCVCVCTYAFMPGSHVCVHVHVHILALPLHVCTYIRLPTTDHELGPPKICMLH